MIKKAQGIRRILRITYYMLRASEFRSVGKAVRFLRRRNIPERARERDMIFIHVNVASDVR